MTKISSLSVAVPAGTTIVIVAGLVFRQWWRSRRAPPTTSYGLPILGPLIQFLKDPLELIRHGHKKHGECFKVNLLAKDMVCLVGRDAQEFFFTMDKYLDQAKMYAFTIPIFGKKVLYDTDYNTRMCQLRFIRERLEPSCLESYVGACEQEVVQFFDELWPGREGVVCIRKCMIECLSRTSVRCLMGPELRAKLHEVCEKHTICELLHHLEQGMLPLSVFMPWAPIARHRQRDAARREMKDFLLPILAARRKKLQEKGGVIDEEDFLWKVMQASYPDGRPVSDDEIVGFLIAGFFGGMHNSSITTSWSTLEIFTRPQLVKELQDEQRALVGGTEAKFTYEAYGKMKKLRSAVMETLRLHPPLFLLMRTVEADIKFKQFDIPRGSVISVSPYISNRLSESFGPDPEGYQPFRFAAGTPDEFAFIPFGAGRRLCKGQEFGYLQIMCVLSYMLRNFNCECLDGVTEPTIGEGMVIAPSQPCRVQYKRV